jgi:opacity protein-like surface antigen
MNNFVSIKYQAIMKKTIILTLAAFLTHGIYAQIPKGTMALTGTIGFNGSKNLSEETSGNNTATTWDQTNRGRLIMPAFSYFVSDKIEGGLGLMLMSTKTMNDYHPNIILPNTVVKRETTSPFNGVLLFGNYYFKNEEKFACYGGVQLGVGSGTSTTETTLGDNTVNKTDVKNSGSTFGFNFGFLYFVRHNLALNANFGLVSFNSNKSSYTQGNTEYKTQNSDWTVGVNGTVVNIGLKFLLNRSQG